MALKKKDRFLNYLVEISSNLKECADYSADYKPESVNDLIAFSEKIKEFELKGDKLVHEVITELHNAFITPIEREDILALTMSMDDVLDGIEHTAALFEMYEVVEMNEYIVQFVTNIRQCTNEIIAAVQLLSNKKLMDIRQHAINIKEIETKCDGILRASIKHLFSNEKDPIRIIQYKEIYEELENIADFCQAVANTLESIIMKNA